MLENHIPCAIEKEEKQETLKLTKEQQSVEKKKREEEKLKKLREKNELIQEKNRLLEEQKRIKTEGKIVCGCGGYYELSNKVHHFKTKKHLTWEASQKEEIV